jgi:hypothetical protein
MRAMMGLLAGLMIAAGLNIVVFGLIIGGKL